jgi:hypothetical protein
MTKLVTKNFSLHSINQFIDSLIGTANNNYYLFNSKHTPFDDDNNPPAPSDNTSTLKTSFYKEMIFGKKITSSDVVRMIPRYDWVSNTVYAQYSDTGTDLYNKNFYVVVDNGAFYYVYKVLENNNGSPSTVSPIASVTESACNFITTADGYKWKLMYKLSESTFEKFATNGYVPVYNSANVSGNSIAGAVDTILVSNNGSGYISTFSSQFQSDDIRDAIPTISGNSTTYRLSTNAASNSNFYTGCAIYLTSGTGAGQLKEILSYNPTNRVIVVNSAFTTSPDVSTHYLINPNIKVVGDGSGAAGYAVISSNATVNGYISSVYVTDRGSNYTYASATVAGNTGGVTNTAILQVVMPPVGGHGFNSPEELGASVLGISVTLSNTESGYISTENDFRTYGIVSNVLFKNVTLTLNSALGTFAGTENVYQVSYKDLTGNVSVSSTSNNIIGTLTDLTSLAPGDKIILWDRINSLQCIRTVTSVTNSTYISINSNSAFSIGSAGISYVDITATARRLGNTSPYLTLTNTEPGFILGGKIIGAESGAFANVTAIAINEKPFNNWSFFDNRTRINYTAAAGVTAEDALMFQQSLSLSNAYYHSSNSTYVFLTNIKGTINADPDSPLVSADSNTNFTLGSVKYEPDIVESSGKVLYIENNNPIARSNTQSEVFRVLFDF